MTNGNPSSLWEPTMPAQPDREALIQETLQRLREKLEKNLPADDATLEQIEDAVQEIGSDVFRDLQERLTNQRSTKARENRIACPCGSQARYRRMQARTLVTRHGLLQWRRPYYYCDTCGWGYAPLDASLGLDGADTTPQVREWMAYLSPQLGFEQATDTLRRLRGIDVSAATVERVAVRAGTSLRRTQQKEAALHHEGNLPDRKRPCPRRLYIQADGVMTPLRDPWKKDGSGGKLQCRFGECKTGVVYETYQDRNGRDQRIKTRAYSATLGSVETFETMLGSLAHECGHHGAREVVVLGDGAPWIWHLFGRQFAGALQILDFFHACGHLAAVADAIYGKGSDRSRAWQTVRQAELKADGVLLVLRAIAAWKPVGKEAHHLRRSEFGYFRRNAERMRYGTFLHKGYHIGSGIVEAACKHVVAQRLDQAGMHWTPAVAEAILTLRANQLSSYPSDLRPHLTFAA
jgi:hypothetical protein